MRLGRAGTAVAAIALGVSVAAAEGARPPRADLVVGKAPVVAEAVTQGAHMRVTDVVRNKGGATTKRSLTRYYLSRDRKRSRGDVRLPGGRRVGRLKAGRKSRGGARVLVPVGIAAGRYRLLACADDRRKTREVRERNNCRASRALNVVARSRSMPTPGSAGTSACKPGVPDVPDPAFADTNCDGIDGTAADAVFVSTLGSDTAPGTMASPKRTVAAAVAAAAEAARDVYVARGTYDETLFVANGVSVYGGYEIDWRRSTAAVTRLADSLAPMGASEGAVAVGISAPTTLQLLTLAPRASTSLNASSYGLRVVGSPGLLLEHVTATGAPGHPGSDARNGEPGAPGHKGGDANCVVVRPPGAGGAGGSPGRGGGNGGAGSFYSGHSGPGQPGAAGGIDGGGGGAGGTGGVESRLGGNGGHGHTGAPGVAGSRGIGGIGGTAASAWTTLSGGAGSPGTHGHGGGGGGGGGTATDGINTGGNDGGGGGGGGAGGTAGGGGGGGGGSFGVYVSGSRGTVIRNSAITASAGGAGGDGGTGAPGGAGALGGFGMTRTGCLDAGAGGNGGHGGGGGHGGHGGGGAGGPSIALYLRDSQVTTIGSRLSFARGGAGGDGGAPRGSLPNDGAAGASAATNTP